MERILVGFNHRYYQSLMLFSVYMYTLLFIPNDDVAKVFQGVLLLGSLPIFFIYKDKIFKDPMIKLLGIVIVAQILSWGYSYIYHPEFANSGPKIDRLAKLFSFIFIAYWLKGQLNRTYLLWFSLVAGFFIAIVTQETFFQEVTVAMQGTRVDFSIKNAQFTSMFAGVSILIVSFIAYQTINKASDYNNKHTRLLSLLVCLMLFLFSTFVIVVTQSRQIWLALIVVIALSPLFYYWSYRNINLKYILSTYLAFFIIIVVASQSEVIMNRILTESSTVQSILSGDTRNIPMTSIGIRVNSWLESIAWIKESPLIGHGPEAISEVIQRSDIFPISIKLHISHLHNSHIEVLVAYGVLGLASIYTMYYWLIKSVSTRLKPQPELTPFFMFAFIFVAYWFTVNLFETFNSRSMGVYTHNIMFAGLYTFYLTHTLNRQGE